MQERSEPERYATGEAPGRQPDQAEGERAGDEGDHPMPEEARRPTPSQAEGDRETVDAAVAEHERRGN